MFGTWKSPTNWSDIVKTFRQNEPTYTHKTTAHMPLVTITDSLLINPALVESVIENLENQTTIFILSGEKHTVKLSINEVSNILLGDSHNDQ